MPRKFFKKMMPDHKTIREHKHLQIFGKLLHEPNLWHMNRRSVAGAFAVGLFNAFMPVPFQMLLAAGGAILFRVNLPLSVALVWITNPLTMGPMFYGTYQIGAWILNTPKHAFNFELSMNWLMNELGYIWQPFLLGCLVTAIVSSVLGYVSIRLLWRWHIVQHLKQRSKRKCNKSNQ
ncbi:MAG TPA: DUF2062 domain-containing protein [Gammaproteobacteria bacterium]|nr:DUF2062 domain-containing protein [Gammaproteobacteria bacterium]